MNQETKNTLTYTASILGHIIQVLLTILIVFLFGYGIGYLFGKGLLLGCIFVVGALINHLMTDKRLRDKST